MNKKELEKINKLIEKRLKKLSEVGQELFIEDLLVFIEIYKNKKNDRSKCNTNNRSGTFKYHIRNGNISFNKRII